MIRPRRSHTGGSIPARTAAGRRRLRATARSRLPRRGFSLLEAILAMAILATSVAVLGELARMGLRNSAAARDLTSAQLLCESKMNEIGSGLQAAAPVQDAPFDATLSGAAQSEWLYSVAVTPLDLYGLVAVQVTVKKNAPNETRPAQYTLTKWMKDPSLILLEETTEEGATGSSASSSTSGMGSGGGAGGY